MRFLISIALALTAVSAHGGVVAVATSGDGSRVVLRDDVGPCVGKAKLAEYVPLDGAVVPGCWLAAPGHVLVSFLDGERGKVPVADLKSPAAAQEPAPKTLAPHGGTSRSEI